MHTISQRQVITAPDTLDLTFHARQAIHALTLMLSPDRDYEPTPDAGMMLLAAKHLEALPMMRVMCGSEDHLAFEHAAMHHLVGLVDEPGLLYSPNRFPERRSGRGYKDTDEDYASPYATARFILAMMAWQQRDGDAVWNERIERLVNGLKRIAVLKDEYAYYPDAEYGYDWVYLKASGYTQTAEPAGEHSGGEGTVRFYQANQIRALTRWWEMTGDEDALALAGRLTRFLMKPQFWEPSWVPEAQGLVHGHYRGHTHGCLTAIRALLRYAMATRDDAILRFCQSCYEYTKQFTLPRIGWVPAWIGPHPIGHKIACEACTISGLIAVACKLTEAGVGDYSDDIDAYTRNHLIESQLYDDERVDRLLRHHAVHLQQIAADGWTRENALGGFQGASDLGGLYMLPCSCCTANASSALFYAWDHILCHRGDTVDVNMLLNRHDAAVSVASYLPYEGKAVITNTSTRRVSVRIPGGVAMHSVTACINGTVITPAQHGRRLMFDDLKPGDRIEIGFPVQRTCERMIIPGGLYARGAGEIPEQIYDVHFKGTTVIGIDTIQGNALMPEYPVRTYQRAHMNADTAPMKDVSAYVATYRLHW